MIKQQKSMHLFDRTAGPPVAAFKEKSKASEVGAERTRGIPRTGGGPRSRREIVTLGDEATGNHSAEETIIICHDLRRSNII